MGGENKVKNFVWTVILWILCIVDTVPHVFMLLWADKKNIQAIILHYFQSKSWNFSQWDIILWRIG